uniref:PLD phosphodiesterase domain-containing protein n=1 Tax=Knipowitschia caucasica TaxID=637954 RepID=A0AAV2JJM7_KNICA
MTALTKGHLLSSFWVIDNKHFYFGSASMDWRSLATRKELGVVVYNCSCLALDLHKVFSLYWGLQYKDFIPTFWSKRLFALFNRDQPLELTLNSTKAQAYVSTSPDVLIPKDRSSDLEAISRVILNARRFIYISIPDYLPLFGMNSKRYWSRIDGFIREALLLRKVHVRLLISCWENTNPLTFNFLWSLKSLCMEQVNCSLEAKFFRPRVLRDGNVQGINHNRFMVTDGAIYLGNLDWVGNEFSHNAGAGLVISQSGDEDDGNSTVVDHVRMAFERDWFSLHTHSLQPNKIPICNKLQIDRLAPVKLPHHGKINDQRPAPIRKKEGFATRRFSNKSLLNTHQDATGGLLIENYQERGQAKPSYHDNKKLHVNDKDSQTAESSGSRESCLL